MKHFKLFFACALMSLFSLGQLWAEDVSFAFTTIGSTGWSNSYADHSVDCTDGTVTMNASKQTSNITDVPVTKGQPVSFVLSDGTKSLSAVSFTCTQWTTKAQTITLKYSTDGGSSYSELSPTVTSTNFSISSSSLPTGTNAVQITFNSQSNQVGVASMSYTMAGGAPSPSLSVDPTIIDFGTVEQGASVAAKTVAVTYANLTGSVTYSGLSGAFAATGTISNSGDEITITPSTATIGNYNQTLTIQSTADSKSQEVTVTMNVVEPFDGLKLTFDVSSNPGEWPTANDASLTNYTYTLSAVDYTFGLKNVKCNSGYLMLTQPAVLGLPAISGYKLVKVEATNSSGCSTTTKVKIANDEAGSNVVSGGAEQTWGIVSSTYTYTLSGTTANTMYYLIVGNKNCQLVSLTLYYVEDASNPPAATPTFPTGEEHFLTSTSVTLASATDGAEIRYTIDGTDPTSTSTLYSAPIELSATTTIKAIAIKDGYDNSTIAEKTFTKGTKITVAEAIALIPNTNDTQDNQFVEGYVCTAGASVSSGKMTYYISDDGTETNRLQIYLGKNLNNTNFSAVSDLGLQDKVVVFGQLKNYSGTPEMNSGNYIVSREAAAIATPTFTPDGAGFLTTLSVALACETEGTQIRYTLDGTEPTELSTLYTDPIELSATTIITAAAFKGGNASSAVARTFTKGSVITVTAALAAIDALADNGTIENQFVEGVISQIDSYNGTYHSITYWISADGTTTDQLEVYSGLIGNAATPLGKEAFDAKENLEVGDQVVIYGTLKKYVKNETTTPEFDKNNIIYSFSRKSDPGISWDPESAELTLNDYITPADYPEPGLIILADLGDNPLDFITLSSDNESLATINKTTDGQIKISWKPDVSGTVHFTATFDGNETYKAVTAVCTVTINPDPASLSPWATVYTSNLNDVTGAKVKFFGEDTEYDAIKAGTSGVAGTATINVPAQATALHLHAYGWKGETITLSITAPAGVTVTPSTIDINSNTGITSNSPFTLAEGSTPQTDAYYAVTLSGNAAATDITISATSGKRFVLFGVNQEGGVLPVLESIEISGDLDNKTGYKAGDALDLTGLTVEATYSLAGTPQAPVDITSDPGLTLTYDPLVENQTEVTITATFGGETDDITITGLEAVASATPEIITDVNSRSWTVTKDAAIPAGKTFTVTLNSVAAATAALGGTNPGAFSIDKTDLVDGDVITVSVVSTATVGSYTATITISDNAGVAADKVVTVNLTVNEPEVPETPVSTTSKWVEATAISNGMEVIIVGVNGDDAYAMGEQGGNNRAAVAGTLDAGVFTPGDNTMSFIVVAQEGGTYALRASNGKYLYAASSGNNYLRSQAELDDNGKWTLTISSAVANGTNTRNIMQFNSSSSIFACYGSESQKPIAFYVPQSVTPTADYTRDDDWMKPGELGTICIPNGVASIVGANIYELAGKDASGNVVFASVAAMEPGLPYLFEATANKVEFFFSADPVASAGNHNGMYGTFSAITITDDLANTYYFAGHTLWSSSDLTSTGLSVPANRAYIKMDEVPTMGGASPAPGKRYITLSVHGANATTGMDELNATDAPRKMIMDGQLFILRGEKLYDATGRLVK